jgi:hypothetical protein
MSAAHKQAFSKHQPCRCGSVDIAEDNQDAAGPNKEPRQIVIHCKKCNHTIDPVYYTPNQNGLNRARAVIAARKKWNNLN